MRKLPDEILEKIRKHALWLKGEDGGERAYLEGADLRRADLEGAYLEGAYLEGAYLEGAYLEGAYLEGADLCGAEVIYASCGWTDHGERGRVLRAYSLKPFETVIYSCRCFSGSLENLRAYIERGEERLKSSRSMAADFIAARMSEMLESRKPVEKEESLAT